MKARQADAFALHVGNVAHAMVHGVLRAMAARKEFKLPPGSTLGGCSPIAHGGSHGTVKVAVTIAGKSAKRKSAKGKSKGR